MDHDAQASNKRNRTGSLSSDDSRPNPRYRDSGRSPEMISEPESVDEESDFSDFFPLSSRRSLKENKVNSQPPPEHEDLSRHSAPPTALDIDSAQAESSPEFVCPGCHTKCPAYLQYTINHAPNAKCIACRAPGRVMGKYDFRSGVSQRTNPEELSRLIRQGVSEYYNKWELCLNRTRGIVLPGTASMELRERAVTDVIEQVSLHQKAMFDDEKIVHAGEAPDPSKLAKLGRNKVQKTVPRPGPKPGRKPGSKNKPKPATENNVQPARQSTDASNSIEEQPSPRVPDIQNNTADEPQTAHSVDMMEQFISGIALSRQYILPVRFDKYLQEAGKMIDDLGRLQSKITHEAEEGKKWSQRDLDD